MIKSVAYLALLTCVSIVAFLANDTVYTPDSMLSSEIKQRVLRAQFLAEEANATSTTNATSDNTAHDVIFTAEGVSWIKIRAIFGWHGLAAIVIVLGSLILWVHLRFVRRQAWFRELQKTYEQNTENLGKQNDGEAKELDENKITPVQAADVLEGLRYRWRGDATELETIHALGKIYLSLGRYREALEALRSAGQRLPDLPEAVQIQADLGAAFRSLFLDGQADGLQPIQALALFYDFKELTPIGADGDLMVRKLARRLVDVDLLSQAADILKYQEENRLDGVPRAEVATDLATIDLMNRQPEAAIDALNESRTTLLPSSLNAQRRVVEARAWLGLGQYDHALEIIQGDKGGDPDAIRAARERLRGQLGRTHAAALKHLHAAMANPGPFSPAPVPPLNGPVSPAPAPALPPVSPAAPSLPRAGRRPPPGGPGRGYPLLPRAEGGPPVIEV